MCHAYLRTPCRQKAPHRRVQLPSAPPLASGGPSAPHPTTSLLCLHQIRLQIMQDCQQDRRGALCTQKSFPMARDDTQRPCQCTCRARACLPALSKGTSVLAYAAYAFFRHRLLWCRLTGSRTPHHAACFIIQPPATTPFSEMALHTHYLLQSDMLHAPLPCSRPACLPSSSMVVRLS